MRFELKAKHFISLFIGALLVVLMIFSPSSMACGFYKDRERGWFWFEQNKNENELEELPYKRSNKNTEIDVNKSAEDQIKELQKKLNTTKAEALINPSLKNVAEYIYLQKQSLQMASEFGKYWQLALLQYPELSNPRNPTDNSAVAIADKQNQKIKEAKITKFANEFGLIFFVSNGCEYCHASAPILKNFQEKYNFSVTSISSIKSDIEGFRSQVNPSLVKKLNIMHYPSLYAYSPKENLIVPIGYGYLSFEELEKNTLYVIDHINSGRSSL